MTLFEYLAIAFSLVFSASALRLVSGLPHAIQGPRRDAIHLCFLGFQLLNTIAIFWIFWSFREVEWTFPKFLLTLVSPGLLYYKACTLVPESPAEVGSWRAYWEAARRRYFGAFCCWVLAITAISTFVLELPLRHPGRWIQGVGLAAALVGLLSADRRVHAGLAALFLVGSLAGVFTYAFWPGGFAQ